MKTRTRTSLVVVGALVALLALAALASAGALLWLRAAHDEGGYLTSSAHRLHTDLRALVSMTISINSAVPGWAVDKLRVQAKSDKPLFLGVARPEAVDSYLSDVASSTVEDLDAWPFSVAYEHHPGSRVPAAPSSRRFWTASSSDDVRWPLRRGTWTVVLMNADGSSGVDAEVSIGAKVRGVLPVGVVLAVLGALLAALAGWMISRGSGARTL